MDTSVIGRESELAFVGAFLDEVSCGPVGLLIEGEAGIGKTTLWRQGVAAAADRSYRVLSCRPVQAEVKLSFAALGDLFGAVGPDILAGLPDPQRRALEIALLRAGPDGCSPDRRAVSVAAVAVLRRLAQAGPLVVAVDDVQWLDGPSSRVLEFAIRRLHQVQVAMLVSFRTDGKVVPLDLDGVLPEGSLYRLPVGPLNLGALQHLIRARTNASLSRPVLLRIHEATGGNPFFALEIARTLQQKGAGYGWQPSGSEGHGVGCATGAAKSSGSPALPVWHPAVQPAASGIAVAAISVRRVVDGTELAGPAGRGRVGCDRLLIPAGGEADGDVFHHTGLGQQQLGLLIGMAQQAEDTDGACAGGWIGLSQQLCRGISRIIRSAAGWPRCQLSSCRRAWQRVQSAVATPRVHRQGRGRAGFAPLSPILL